MPNAGKSSILNFVTNAKSKVADYAFTTLHPHIGMVQKEDLEFVLADIPGLIENASDGKGLGHDFLSHVERCKILIHVIDTTEADPFKNYQIIRQELENYGAEIESKKEIIALNKVELLDEKEVEQIKEKFSSLDRRIFTISAATGYHLDQLTNLCLEYLQDE
jgi:GTP-binding protein